MSRRRLVYNSPNTAGQVRNNWSLVNPTPISSVGDAQSAVGGSGVTQGQVVAIDSSGDLVPALADGSDLSTVVGLADEDAAAGYSALVFGGGLMTYGPGGLVAGVQYYLSAVTPGALVSAPDDTSEGCMSIIIGVARSATELWVHHQVVARY